MSYANCKEQDAYTQCSLQGMACVIGTQSHPQGRTTMNMDSQGPVPVQEVDWSSGNPGWRGTKTQDQVKGKQSLIGVDRGLIDEFLGHFLLRSQRE